MRVAVLVLVVGLAPWAARADLPPAVRRLAEEGAAALQAGRLEAAQAALEKAYRMKPSPLLLQQLGEVARAQGQVIVAVDLFRRALAEGGAELSAQPQMQSAVQEPLGPRTELAISGEDGAFVLLDGRLVGVLPLAAPLLVSAGAHEVRLEKDGRSVKTRIELGANRPAELRFTLLPPVAVLTLTEAAVVIAEHEAVPAALRQRLLQAATEQAVRERVLLLPRERLEGLAAAPGLAGCSDDLTCQERLAEKVEARYVLVVRSALQPPAGGGRPVGQGTWRFSVRVHDVSAGALGASGEEVCASCGAEEAAQRLGALVRRVLREAATRPRGTLEVEVKPPQASVLVDGRRVGVGAVRRPAFAGEHEVRAEHPGFLPYRGTVLVSDGQVARVQVELVKGLEPVPSRGARPAPLYRRWWFWTAVGGAVATTVAASIVASTYLLPLPPPPREFPYPRILDF
ncbi:MAG: PEGA domain-containing protein [Myxococcales bacterium]|nr:PEGA domain-containing protein [Myxococcota bacterium]MDW8280883.1 PEGA domain-containing protein [Myxococcales bacterium]